MPLFDARIAALRAKCETALFQIVHTTALELHFVGLREISLLDAFRTRYDGGGTALELVDMVTEPFLPSGFRRVVVRDRRNRVWKRAHIAHAAPRMHAGCSRALDSCRGTARCFRAGGPGRTRSCWAASTC
jgi:hypothetical protein